MQVIKNLGLRPHEVWATLTTKYLEIEWKHGRACISVQNVKPEGAFMSVGYDRNGVE